MTKIVGIDFGTSNVRIAQRDNGGDTKSCAIGMGLSETGDEWVRNNDGWMPAVIAFTKQPNGDVKTVIGEAANALPSDAPNVIVVPNIKRLATASDRRVREVIEWYFERKGTDWPEWLDPQNRSIRVWDKTVPAEEAIKLILKEAIARAGLAGKAAEWRAGCPVSSDLAYRKALIAALDELGCEGKVRWIIDEPLLLLALGKGIASRALKKGIDSGELGEDGNDGLYMVYDLGGGSFDCAVARIAGDSLTVYANEGLPQGGADIDRLLAQAGISDWNNERVLGILDSERFITETLTAMLNAYHKANTILKLPEDEGEYVPNLDWSNAIESMTAEIDKFLVVGGPTENPYFLAKLRGALGEVGAKKIVTADDMVQSAGRTDINDARITALSHGACYMDVDQYIPVAVAVDRIPATISLTVSDGRDTCEDAYEAFSRMPYRNPNAPYEGDWVTLQSDRVKTYRVVVENADGVVIHDSSVVLDSEGCLMRDSEGCPIRVEQPMRMPREGYLGPVADRAKLVIDRFGSVWVRLGAGSPDVPQPLEDNVVIWRTPPWQTDLQKADMEKYEEIQRRREERERARRIPKPVSYPHDR